MASSTLDPDNIPGTDRQLGKGHGTDALGPSDLSDTGSDVQGGYRGVEQLDLGLDRGTNEDSDSHNIAPSTESDDSTGTGEDSTAGRHGDIALDRDIGFDRIETIDPDSDAMPDLDRDIADEVHMADDGQAATGTDATADDIADIDADADDVDGAPVDELDGIPDPDPDVDGDELLFDKDTSGRDIDPTQPRRQ